MIGKPLYKSDAVAGHTWHEWIKMAPGVYHVIKIYGDGSCGVIYTQSTETMARKSCGLLNTPKYTKPQDIEYMALVFYYTDDWKKYLYKNQIAELEPRRIDR